jgi:hypothetical protein
MAAKHRRFGDLVARAPSNAATRHASKHAEKQAKKRETDTERERERDSPGGRDETRGFDRWGPDLRVATGTFARCFLPFGISRVFLDRVWRKGRVMMDEGKWMKLLTLWSNGGRSPPLTIYFESSPYGTCLKYMSYFYFIFIFIIIL